MLKLIRSLAHSIGTAIRHDPEVERLIATHPRSWGFIASRLDRSQRHGLVLTAGAAIALAFLALFFGVVEDLLAGDPLIEADFRIVSLVQMFRNPAFDQLMLFFTYLGNWQVVALGAGLMAAWLALGQRWLWLQAMFVSIGLGEGFVWIFKNLFQRARPDLANALVTAHGASFPSGHAFVAFAFYGLAAWFLMASVKSMWLRALIAAMALAAALAIGFSRVYLGVHWPSDVLASYVFGSSWLVITVTLLLVLEEDTAHPLPRWAGLARWAAAPALVLAWAAGVAVFYETHPLVRRTPPELPAVDIAESGFPQNLFASAPRFSEDIIGRPMEPVNVIVIGSERDMSQAFAAAGWQPTEQITLATSWRLLIAELFNKSDPRAPGTPSFWRGNPNRLGFERPTEANSARERHHLHVWNTAYRVGDVPVWVGTAHRDTTLPSSFGFALPVHAIDPAIDREREAIRSGLEGGPCTSAMREDSVTEPMMGQNAAGNGFFTDGKALIVTLACK